MKTASRFINYMHADDRYPADDISMDPADFAKVTVDAIEEFKGHVAITAAACKDTACARLVMFIDLSIVLLGMSPRNLYISMHDDPADLHASDAFTEVRRRDPAMAKAFSLVMLKLAKITGEYVPAEIEQALTKEVTLQ